MSAPFGSSIAHARPAIDSTTVFGPPGQNPLIPLAWGAARALRPLEKPIFKTPERPHGQKPGTVLSFSYRKPPSGAHASSERSPRSLLELNLRADLLQGGLDLLRLFLADAFLDRLRRAFDEVLGFLEAERRDRADFLDHFDFFIADGGEDDGELGLLLDGRRSGGGRSGGDGDRCGGRNAPLGFEEFCELGGFENRQGGQFVDDRFKIGHG